MMRPSNKLDHVWLAREAVDFRKGINGLSVLVEEQLAHDPFSGQLFVFVNKKRDKVKILCWGVPRTFGVSQTMLW
jgi:transposase